MIINNYYSLFEKKNELINLKKNEKYGFREVAMLRSEMFIQARHSASNKNPKWGWQMHSAFTG